MFLFHITLISISLLTVVATYTDPHCHGRQVIVELFGWKWTDVADECERYLSKKRYCGVQVSPANEHAIITKDYPRPWWERYQPVSYKLTSRSGTEAQFTDMVTRCNNVGIRVYVDVVINHMTGLGRKGTGSAGSTFNADNYEFQGVPYSRVNFNTGSKCPSGDGNIHNYFNANEVRNCRLSNLTDLDQSQEYVRDKIAGYFNHLIDIGVAGFRVDASKHMWPADLKTIEDRTKNLPTGRRPFFCHEVIDENDQEAVQANEYTPLGYVTEFKYCQQIAQGISSFSNLNNIHNSGMIDSDHALVFVDNHDNQRHHGGGGNVVTYKQPRDYKMATAFTLAYNYGLVRVMSSYEFSDNEQGPPHNQDFSIKNVTLRRDATCDNGWVCEHRWPAIANMVVFRNAVRGTSISHWRNQNDEVSFSRGTKGFFAMAKQGHMNTRLQTGLPAGQYCDLISDCRTTITVDSSGFAHIVIDNNEAPILAFIVGKRPISSNTNSYSTAGISTSTRIATKVPVSTVGPSYSGWARTIIMVQKFTHDKEDLFILGGIDPKHRAGCHSGDFTDNCSIPIKSHPVGTTGHYDAFHQWQIGDTHLDWYGREPGQGEYNHKIAEGTPAVWTTNDPNHAGYLPSLNTYGSHYWLVDVDMDCSKTEHGWFEFKSKINNGWEHDVHTTSCSYNHLPDPVPWTSENHWARCGAKNVYHFDQSSCEILPISN